MYTKVYVKTLSAYTIRVKYAEFKKYLSHKGATLKISRNLIGQLLYWQFEKQLFFSFMLYFLPIRLIRQIQLSIF